MLPAFAEVAADRDATLDIVALALAAEFREVDVDGAMATLDALGAGLARAAARSAGTPAALALACAQTLGLAQGFAGDRAEYDDPRNSMLDIVLTRRRGLPILLSVVYIETARRAGIALDGVGLRGHFVVGHFGAEPPLLLDPFDGGTEVPIDLIGQTLPRPWTAREIAMRMLNNLVAAYRRRGDLGAAIHAAAMRLELPTETTHRDELQGELRAMQAQLN